MIGIVNYKAGNAQSVSYALKHLDLDHFLIENASDVKKASVIILPGVGSAKATLQSLKEQQLLEAVRQTVLEEGVFFLGICVGLQVLFEHSQEHDTPCLHWLEGNVRRFDTQGGALKVPQIGWNTVQFASSDILKKAFSFY